MGYLKLTTARTEYLDNWICDETLFRLISAHLPHLKNNTFTFTRKLLIRAIGAKAVPFHGKHEHEYSIFLKQFQTSCPYDDTRRRVTYFYRQVNRERPADPVSARDITDVHTKNNQIRRNAIRGLVNNTRAEISPCRNEAVAAAATMMTTTMTPRQSWRQTTISPCRNDASPAAAVTMVTTMKTRRRSPRRTTAPSSSTWSDRPNERRMIADTLMPEGGEETMGGGATGNDARRGICGSVPIYWDSPEAAKVFGFCYENGDNVFQGIEKQLSCLPRI